MSLRQQFGRARQFLLASVHSRPYTLTAPNPMVSFCFDDFPRTAYTEAKSILDAFGVRATYYAAPALMNTRNELGDQFTQSDLEELLVDGHELACHTFSHISCRKVLLSEFEHDVHKGRRWLHELTGHQPLNFAYPFGHVTISAKKRIGAQMQSCRGISHGINEPVSDLNLLRANSLYGGIESFPAIDSLLRAVEERGGWLIFYTHDVRQNPSGFGCTPALLEKAVSCAVRRGLRVAPVQSVIAKGDRVVKSLVPKVSDY
jgi:peptidoglycan/xylan/chitin deacetylase (PgdA/CDA1 family)